MNNIKIRSVNIHGLRNKWKRKSFFNVIKRSNFDIVCIQESYITENDVDLYYRQKVKVGYFIGLPLSIK